jgi:hypothetical protein
MPKSRSGLRMLANRLGLSGCSSGTTDPPFVMGSGRPPQPNAAGPVPLLCRCLLPPMGKGSIDRTRRLDMLQRALGLVDRKPRACLPVL